MDKRKNKILMGCLALLLVMTVGYALFSENITINGTATAKGDFDMSITCTPDITTEFYNSALGMNEDLREELKTELDYLIAKQGGYDNDSCVVNDKVVSFKANLNYPGARRYFTIKVTNTGSIPFHFKDSIEKSSVLSGTVTDVDGNVYDANNEVYTGVKQYLIYSEFAAFDKKIALEDIDSGDYIVNTMINPGESFYLLTCTSLLENFGSRGGHTLNGFDITKTATYELVFEQITN